jgi:hypothetical protein
MKIDLGEKMGEMVSPEKEGGKYYQKIYVDAKKAGINKDEVGEMKDVGLTVKIASYEMKSGKAECCLELHSLDMDEEEREENEGDETQNALEDGFKDHMEEKGEKY